MIDKVDFILLSPSKEMMVGRSEKTIQKNEEASLKKLEHPLTKDILTKLREFDFDELTELYGLSSEKIQLEQERLAKIGEEPATAAFELYDGVAFRELKKEGFSKAQEDFLKKHLVILSAFYGPLYAGEEIWPYRLDFMMKFKLKDKGLRGLWKKEIEDFFYGKTILNLASKEFSSLLQRKTCQLIDVEFLGTKKISTYEKKSLRGALAGHLIRERRIDKRTLDSFDKGFSVDYEKDRIIFKKGT